MIMTISKGCNLPFIENKQKGLKCKHSESHDTEDGHSRHRSDGGKA